MTNVPTVATVVTALYDIGRANLTGEYAYRPFTKYLSWFKNLLSLNVPMVIFIPDYLHSYVLEHRSPDIPTTVIIRNFEDLSAYKYHDRIQDTIDSMILTATNNKSIPHHFITSPEFITAKYETIIFSKFDLLKEVAASNQHNSKYFIWLDAGTFYQPPPLDNSLPWPDPYKMEIIEDKFLVANNGFDPLDSSPLNDKYSYLLQSKNGICAYILAGTKEAIDRTHTLFWNEVDNALSLGVINNEQHILQLMALERPLDYYLWYHTSHQYPNLPNPQRDRMIPTELALGTPIGENYFINPQLKVLAVATREIAPSEFSRWEATALQFGYNYEIIGRDMQWKGFNTKIRLCQDKLQSVNEPYTLITDCTDVFFCGSSSEILNKFISLDKDVIVGGEMEMYYPGKTDKPTIEKFFENIRKSPQSFPNGGFILGKTDKLLELMTMNIEYSDDQASYFDTIHQNKFPLAIDYDTTLIANIANYHNRMDKILTYFQFDPKLNRYYNVHTHEYPSVFHFPGKNWGPMTDFYRKSQSHFVVEKSNKLAGFDQSNTSSSAAWIFLLILLLLIIICITVYLTTYKL